jgi:hypothetical protein
MLCKIKAKEGKKGNSPNRTRERGKKPKRNEGAQAAMQRKKQTPLRVIAVDQCVQQEGV